MVYSKQLVTAHTLTVTGVRIFSGLAEFGVFDDFLEK